MEKNSGTKSDFFFRFYILFENFSKIGPILKKNPNFVNDPLKSQPVITTTARKTTQAAVDERRTDA